MSQSVNIGGTKHITYGCAGCSSAPQHGHESFQIIPAGEFRAKDGRPREVAAWRLSSSNAIAFIQKFRAQGKPLLVDYEHQTLNSAKNGRPAPAAGWIKDLEWRPGKGFFAVDTEWTQKARAYLRSKEYRYISPVISYNKETGDILDILHIALTNNPALDQLPELALQAAAKSSYALTVSNQNNSHALSEVEMACCKAMNVEPQDFINTKQEDSRRAALITSSNLSLTEVAVCRQMGISETEFISTKLQGL